MIRLSLFISLLLTSVAVLADVQINIRGNVYTQNLTIGSRLYGESSKIQPGVLSGSATLLMILP